MPAATLVTPRTVTLMAGLLDMGLVLTACLRDGQYSVTIQDSQKGVTASADTYEDALVKAIQRF